MKKTIRLTESDLHRVIRRAVYEATKGERDMSNKQKQRSRNANYIKDVNGSGDKYFHPNTYSDYEPSNVDRYERNAPFHGNDWFDDKVHTDRMKKHRRSQNHKDPDDFMESVIRESVKRVMNEESKPRNSFKSKEDMTRYRDMYAPGDDDTIIDTDNTVYDRNHTEKGSWGSGPFMNYRHTTFADGYDYCGDDDYNDFASDYNRGLGHRLSTKGGQMSYDWETMHPDRSRQTQREIDALNRGLEHRQEIDDIRNGKFNQKSRNRWLRGDSEEDMQLSWEDWADAHGQQFESKIKNIVRESIKRVINEEWYPENENDIDDYYYGAIFKFGTDLVYFDEGENIPEDLLNIKDEYIESENTYASVMVTNVEPEIDETDGSASFTITAAINAPNMPLDEIEEEVTNTVWVWLENKLNKRFTRVWIEGEKVVYDRRSVE